MHAEAAKALAFLTIIRQTLGDIDADRAANLIPDLERYVKVLAGSVLVRGRIDALLGNLVIEFKETLNEESLERAKNKLKTYVAALWAIHGQRINYMLMATDGLRFRVYKAVAPPAEGASA